MKVDDLVDFLNTDRRTYYRFKAEPGVRLRIESARQFLLGALRNGWLTPREVAAPWVKFVEYEVDLEAMKAVKRRIYRSEEEFLKDLMETLEKKYRLVQNNQLNRVRATPEIGAILASRLPRIEVG